MKLISEVFALPGTANYETECQTITSGKQVWEKVNCEIFLFLMRLN
jgi:hypothetical protein